jgi:hypothetical protein
MLNSFCRAQQLQQKDQPDIKPLTLSRSEYDEFFPGDSLRQVGSIIVNIKTQQISEFFQTGLTDDMSSCRRYINMGRWLAIDPQEEKYPSLSPYSAFGNAPLYYTDPGGETLKVAINDQANFAADVDAIFGKGFFNNNFSFGDNGYVEPTKTGLLAPTLFYYANDLDKAILLQGMLTIINSPEVTQIIYQKNATDNIVNPETGFLYRNNKGSFYDNVDNTGGEATMDLQRAKRDNVENVTQNTVFVWSGEIHKQNTPRGVNTFHGMGHVLFQFLDEQEKVIGFENLARNILNLQTRSVNDPDATKHKNTFDPVKREKAAAELDEQERVNNLNNSKNVNLEKIFKDGTQLR